MTQANAILMKIIRSRLEVPRRCALEFCTGPSNGAWLYASPSSSKYMKAREYHAALRYRLMLPQHSAQCKLCAHHTKDERCAEQLDKCGVHAAFCKIGPDRVSRHDKIATVLAQWLNKQGYTTREE